MSDDDLRAAVTAALAPPPTPEEQEERLRAWDPVDLLVPEWRYLLSPSWATIRKSRTAA